MKTSQGEYGTFLINEKKKRNQYYFFLKTLQLSHMHLSAVLVLTYGKIFSLEIVQTKKPEHSIQELLPLAESCGVGVLQMFLEKNIYYTIIYVIFLLTLL